MKKLLNIILLMSILVSNFFIYINVNAATIITATITDSEGVFLRKGPGTNYEKITLLAENSKVNLVSTTKYNDESENNSCPEKWYQVNYNGSTSNYICSSFVTVKTEEITTPTNNNNLYYTSSVWGSRINENYATVRNTPNGSAIEIIYLGTEVKVISTTGSWSKIEYYNGRTGYVYSRLISKYEDITATDEEYFKELKTAGFPESYWPFLTYLHKKYPNWVFKAQTINKSFDTVVSGETGKNYIQTNESNYRLSNIIKENPNWYAANSSIVGFFIDPRNYLTDKNIFAFEELSYDATNQTAEIVKNIFGSSYLSNDEYVKYFMEAAKEYNISPIHLASRVKQEGGANETYAAISGLATTNNNLTYNGNKLDGFYNYYNIGAYQDGITSSAVTRGIAVAAGIIDNYYGTPWDTREKAIKYGAKFISEGYISKGQNTMYFQKFNTADNAYWSSYTHQYMTNIIAPSSESLSFYTTYETLNLLNTAYTFAIPVYKNTPADFTAHPTIGDTNNDLYSITINNNLLESFDSDILSYEYYIPKKSTSVTIDAKAVKSTSSISGAGTVTITENETNIDLIVTSQVGSEKTYSIKIIKSESDTDETTKVEDILSNIDVKLNDSYMSGIGEKTIATSLITSIKKVAPTSNITITDSNKNPKNDILKTGDILTITNGSNVKTYTIVIKGDNSGDGIINSLDLLRLQKHILGYSTLTGAYKEACDTSYDGSINSLDLLLVQKHILGYTKLK